jgi:hypothetical protein
MNSRLRGNENAMSASPTGPARAGAVRRGQTPSEQSAQAAFANLKRRIHSLLDPDA